MAKIMLIRIAIIVTIVLAVLFAFLSIVGNYWVGFNDIHVGLWKGCIKKICIDLDTLFAKKGFKLTEDQISKLRATRAFMVLSIIAYVLAIAYMVLLLLKTLLQIKKELTMRILGIILLVAGFLEILALGIFTDLANEDYAKYFDFSYKRAYAVGWLSAVITIIPAILTFLFGGEGLI